MSPLPLPNSSIRWLLYVSQAFAAAPIHSGLCTQPKPAAATSPLRHYATTVSHLLWSASLYAAIVASMYQQYMFYIESTNIRSFIRYVNLGEFIGSTLNYTIVIVGCNYQRRSYATAWSVKNRLDQQLRDAFGNNVDGLNDERLTVFVRTIATVLLAILAATLVVTVEYNDFDARRMLIAGFAYVVPNIVQLLALIQYVCMLFVIRKRFDCVERSLRRLTEDGRTPQRHRIVVVSSKQWTQGDRMLEDVWLHVRNGKRIFQELHSFERYVHRSFGLLVVLTMLTGFFIIIVELYQFYTFVVAELRPILILHSCDWMLVHFGELFFVLLMCTRLGDAVRCCYFNQTHCWVGAKVCWCFCFHSEYS